MRGNPYNPEVSTHFSRVLGREGISKEEEGKSIRRGRGEIYRESGELGYQTGLGEGRASRRGKPCQIRGLA
jgi:hypothetical protein